MTQTPAEHRIIGQMARMKRRPLPVKPEPFTWWISRDQERWEPTNCDIREAAINEATWQDFGQEIEPQEPGQPWHAGFYVGQYRKRVMDLSQYFDAEEWIEGLYDQMVGEDGSDADGDNHPLEELSASDIRALEACVHSAIWHFQNRRGLKLSPFWLEQAPGTRDEWVTVPLPEQEGAQ